ncbi:MAG: hypothetical protein CME70_03135 [Halobacteriovorax sp.]|nr:hypothetical protein [Halobacteriovorax sp.]MBK22977.1 hypothetical protein [Halobacteriovorax sp.]|tara:strand:- start:16078 stop:16425 length:348 start_codon:yes stop_codon:yes gene_type:complete
MKTGLLLSVILVFSGPVFSFTGKMKTVCRAHVKPRIVKCPSSDECVCIGVRRCVNESKENPVVGDHDVMCKAVRVNGEMVCPEINSCAREKLLLKSPLEEKSNPGNSGTGASITK